MKPLSSRSNKPDGQIITFYSYKGGTGRSMALANVAWILASAGRQVLIVDWDLEAPGLHHYFSPFLSDPDLISTEGVVDFVIECSLQTLQPPEPNDPDKNWHLTHSNILRYASSLEWHFLGGGSLDFIPAGRQGPSYSTRVNSFNWDEFYNDSGGGHFIEAAKQKMKSEYEYILIDSRTGVSDTSGICTVQLPDQIVVCFTLNNQSIIGAHAVAQSIARQARQIRILPVPTRVDPFEQDKLSQRLRMARALFDEFLPRTIEDVDRYWGEVELPYIPYYSYEEILATFGDEPGRSNTILSACERLTSRLTDRRVSSMPSISTTERQVLLRKYAGEEVREEIDAVATIKKESQKREADFRAQSYQWYKRLAYAAAVLGLIIAGLIYQSWRRADEESIRALALRLANDAIALTADPTGDLETAALLAVESLRRHPTPEARQSLSAALAGLPRPDPIVLAETSVWNEEILQEVLVGEDHIGVVDSNFVSVQSLTIRRDDTFSLDTTAAQSRISKAAFIASGRFLLALLNARLTLQDTSTGNEVSLGLSGLRGVLDFAVASGSETLAVLGSKGRLTVFDTAQIPFQVIAAGSHPDATSIAVSPDGNFVATSSSDGEILVTQVPGQQRPKADRAAELVAIPAGPVRPYSARRLCACEGQPILSWGFNSLPFFSAGRFWAGLPRREV